MASNSNYYQFQSAKVAIAEELAKLDWKLYGFKEDESDSMTDYWSPANWDGIATKNGYVVVIDCDSNRYSGKEIREYNYNKENVILSLRVQKLIANLSEVRQDRGATAAEEETARKKIEQLRQKAANNQERVIVTDRYPEYQANPPKMTWHVEKDGVIIAKGNGVAKFSGMKNFNKESCESDLKNFEKDHWRYEMASDKMKLWEKFNKFINKIDTAAGGMIGGDGDAYIYSNVETIIFKKENKAVECEGSLRDGQCFIIKGHFSHGVMPGYVYKIKEYNSENGKYYIPHRLDKKLKKELVGRSNSANSFGILCGKYQERFLKWIEKGIIAWCDVKEFEIPHKVTKCVKQKIK